MTTRSGLSIRKISTPRGLGLCIKKTNSPAERPKKEHGSTKKYPVIKYKSLSYMSFVTRFIIALRVPDLELAGVNPKEAFQFLGENGYFSRSENSSTSESFEDDISDSDEEEVFESVHDNRLFYSCDEESCSSQEENDSLCGSVSGIRLDDFNQNSTEIQHKDNVNLAPRYLGVSFANGEEQPNGSGYGIRNPVVFQVNSENNFPFRCEECNRGFTLYSAYQAHVQSHSKQRNRCGICGKIFTRSWLLKGHMRTHTGERPFPCPELGCDKAFADKSNLRSHMLIHSVTSKNFSCGKCGRAFAQKRYLHKHMLEVCRLL